MIYLSSSGTKKQVQALRASGVALGLMLTPRSFVRVALAQQYGSWAADNGCYSQGESFDLAAYLKWLEKMVPAQSNCLFATAPDVVGDAVATWARSRDVLPQIRELGYKAALVGQNGIEDLEIDWDAFDALFIGGTTAWKLSETAYRLVVEARARGKWCHMGRVNSRKRLIAAAVSGYQSADGTHVSFEPDKKIAQLVRWLGELERQERFIFT